MKIRTITTGTTFSKNYEKQLNQYAEFNNYARDFMNSHYEVQTTRICSQPWPEYIDKKQAVSIITNIDKFCKANNIDFFNIGTILPKDKACIKLIPKINQATERVSSSTTIASIQGGVDEEAIRLTAKAIKEISRRTKKGGGNFRFAALANCPSGIPFFPAAYHGGKTSFAIGLECGDLAEKAFSGTKTLKHAQERLRRIFQKETKAVESLCLKLEKKSKITYRGIDVSLNPGLLDKESIAFAFEKIGYGKFGNPGTLAVAEMVTRTLKSLNVKTCGYSGLMLPILEDRGLAKRSDERTFNLQNILLYSTVCGCGLDTIPLAGSISIKTVENILRDVAALAIRLNKPLSARLFLAPGLKPGEMTDFGSPYMTDCRILHV